MEGLQDIASRLDTATDAEIMRAWTAMRFLKDSARWIQIAATFPEIDADVWPIDYGPVIAWREATRITIEEERLMPQAIIAWYGEDRCVEFINHWGVTYDPRAALQDGMTTHPPLLLFKRQRELVAFLMLCLRGEHHGLIEKCRDMGATWVSCLFSIWLWLTSTGAIGWGSRKQEYVDRIGDPDSIFEKLRMGIRELPPFLLPSGFSFDDHMSEMKIINPANGATITGEIGDNIGRGGRKLIYFKDESAHYPHPDLVEASLGDNTNVQIDISSVNGLGNVFERRRSSGLDWFPGGTMAHDRSNVFVMDWREHPGKDEEWYRQRREKAIREGLLHKFKQEVDRDYAASVEGIIIKAEWVKAAIDAHIKLGLDDSGGYCAGLDVSDGDGGDTNALALFKGIVLREADSWGGVDTGDTTRRTVDMLTGRDVAIQYDCIGVGAGVKAESNRLAEQLDEDDLPLLPEGLEFFPWNAGAGVMNPEEPFIPYDRDGPTNKDMFANMKAQAWWTVARRFENTYRAVEEGIEYEPHELISIDSRIPCLHQLVRELSQPTIKKRPSDLKMLVDKKPDGTKSPNLGDAIIMAAFPVAGLAPVFATAALEFLVSPIQIPSTWPRAWALKAEPERICALLGCYDPDSRTVYITTEHVKPGIDLPVHAAALKARGEWIPVVMESEETNREAREGLAAVWNALGLDVMIGGRDFEAGIFDMRQLLATGRFRVFRTCQRFIREYRAYRRADDGKVTGSALVDCGRILSRPGTISYMRQKPKDLAPTGHRGDRTIGY